MKHTPHVKNAIVRILGSAPQLAVISRLYAGYFNPVNYALVAGVGVLINYLVWSILIWALPGMPWFLTNFLAILCAWSWNWLNSVGPVGWLWGFEKPEKVPPNRAHLKPGRPRA